MKGEKRERPMAQKDLFEALDLPRDVLKGLPRLSLLGEELLLVENHRGIFAYSPQEIRFHSKCGLLLIRGTELEIRDFCAEKALVRGCIYGLFYEKS